MTNCQRNMGYDRNKYALMKKIHAVGLCVHDTVLFLDTHPENQQALAYFSKKRDEFFALKEQYEKRYGPITAFTDKGCDSWKWIEGPWPWQNDCADCSCRGK